MRSLRITTLLLGFMALGGHVATAQPAQARALAGNINANQPIAVWLSRYDMVAWVATDSAQRLPRETLARFGPEWFCFEDGKTWHAIFGKFDASRDHYDIAAHFQVDSLRVSTSIAPIDSQLVQVLGRGVATASHIALPRLAPTRISYNTFVRRLPSRQVEVWYLPAWQQNGVLAYGPEVRFTLDSLGRSIADSSISIPWVRGVAPDTSKTIQLDDELADSPSVSRIFFLINYEKYFNTIYIRTRHALSTLTRVTGSPVWISALRDSTQ